MREFKNPYYDGPDCVCCKSKAENELERILELLDKRITFLGSQKTKEDSVLAEELERMYALIKGENNGTK
jgi:chaperonin cofactor prefoldin